MNSLPITGLVTLKPGEGRLLKGGGFWVFDNEINAVEGACADGDIVQVVDHKGHPMGLGFWNHRSKIQVRILTHDSRRTIDGVFFEQRPARAWAYRKKTMDTHSCRLVFGDADYLPGLVIDKFSDVLVAQPMAFGMDRYKQDLVDQMASILKRDGLQVRGIYERSDAREREKEGLPRTKGFLSAPFDTLVPIVENGVHYIVDIKDGQKTGFFLDQKYNRLAIQKLCPGADVLDCFTHTGSFALNAGVAGAASVLGVDSSSLAVEQAAENARLNGLEGRVHFQCADVFDLLPKLEKEGRQFDVVILDPPAFTKSRASVKNAVKGYREINQRGMRLVRDGGFLATCSCSHFVDYALFTKTIGQAAQTAHRRLRQVEYRTQSPDHPILWAADESYYLKFYIFQVCRDA